jgi:NitT/TauT family transport system permease protein
VTAVLNSAALPLLVLVLVLGAWEATVRGFEVPSYLVPAPSAVLAAFFRGFAEANYLGHAAVTAFQAVAGFLAGSALGIAIGVWVVVFPTAERIVYPYVVALHWTLRRIEARVVFWAQAEEHFRP